MLLYTNSRNNITRATTHITTTTTSTPHIWQTPVERLHNVETIAQDKHESSVFYIFIVVILMAACFIVGFLLGQLQTYYKFYIEKVGVISLDQMTKTSDKIGEYFQGKNNIFSHAKSGSKTVRSSLPLTLDDVKVESEIKSKVMSDASSKLNLPVEPSSSSSSTQPDGKWMKLGAPKPENDHQDKVIRTKTNIKITRIKRPSEEFSDSRTDVIARATEEKIEIPKIAKKHRNFKNRNQKSKISYILKRSDKSNSGKFGKFQTAKSDISSSQTGNPTNPANTPNSPKLEK